ESKLSKETVRFADYVSIVHDERVRSLMFSEDEKNLIAISERGIIRTWETGVDAKPRQIDLVNRRSALAPDISFNTDGRFLATDDGRTIKQLDRAGNHAVLRLEEPSSPVPVQPVTRALIGQNFAPQPAPPDRIIWLQFSQDGHWLASETEKGSIRVADLRES